MKFLNPFFLCLFYVGIATHAQTQFDFEDNLKSEDHVFVGNDCIFVEGLSGKALSLSPQAGYTSLELSDLRLDGSQDFTVQFWIKTHSSKPMAILSQKDFKHKGIAAQKNPGWAIYSSGGTLAWCIGSGDRRLNYERDNGDKLPLADGQWHQLTMTYSKALTEVRLYYDGRHVAVYKVGFDFLNKEPLCIGMLDNGFDYDNAVLPEIQTGKTNLQTFVNGFNQLDAGHVEDDEFIDLIVDPEELYSTKMKAKGIDQAKVDSVQFKTVSELRRKLHSSAYTVYQNRGLTLLKPVSRLYYLKGGSVQIDADVARRFTLGEQLFPADFAMDELVIRTDVLNADAVRESYLKHRQDDFDKPLKKRESLTIGVWNIWHGGIHWNLEKDGWDSRLRIVEILQKQNVDVVLMQETYSSGDFIASELGWYFATTSDWDYCYQGSNISVISRYPIKELFVLPETEFNNVAVKLAVSESQEIYAMSNWYGMRAFSDVYQFNESRFAESDRIPVFFGGDFNAVPHTDGGESPASVKMLENGFTDAYRSLYPDVQQFPGITHRRGHRIDQLYYKGKGVKNSSTVVISDWSGGFPSDHYLIVSRFELGTGK